MLNALVEGGPVMFPYNLTKCNGTLNLAIYMIDSIAVHHLYTHIPLSVPSSHVQVHEYIIYIYIYSYMYNVCIYFTMCVRVCGDIH